MRALQEYTRLKNTASGDADLAWRLVIDAMLFQAEAEIRWLDHCETALARATPPVITALTAATSDDRVEARLR
jgi:hypothetical protein